MFMDRVSYVNHMLWLTSTTCDSVRHKPDKRSLIQKKKPDIHLVLRQCHLHATGNNVQMLGLTLDGRGNDLLLHTDVT